MTTTKTNLKLPPNPFVSEILELASKQKTIAKKIEVLKEYENVALKSILIWNFDDTIISVLPEGIVPYSSVGEQGSFTGTLTGKIDDAVSKMGEIGWSISSIRVRENVTSRELRP